MLQRALPGVYDMFQEYKLDAETEIDLAKPYATYFPSKFSHTIVSSIFFYLFFRFCR
jgi:hypothetical protein